MSFLSKIFNKGPKPIIAHSQDGNLASLRAQKAGPAGRFFHCAGLRSASSGRLRGALAGSFKLDPGLHVFAGDLPRFRETPDGNRVFDRRSGKGFSCRSGPVPAGVPEFPPGGFRNGQPDGVPLLHALAGDVQPARNPKFDLQRAVRFLRGFPLRSRLNERPVRRSRRGSSA